MFDWGRQPNQQNRSDKSEENERKRKEKGKGTGPSGSRYIKYLGYASLLSATVGSLPLQITIIRTGSGVRRGDGMTASHVMLYAVYLE